MSLGIGTFTHADFTTIHMLFGLLVTLALLILAVMAVFAIVRFRNILRDTLDTTYVLTVIVVGMASGTFKFASAVVGCLLV